MVGNGRRNLVDYFKKNLKKGYTKDSLRWALINQGYSKLVVENSLEQAHQELAEDAPIIKEKPKITYEFYDADNNLIPVKIKKSFWRRLFRKF